jgi:excisionase family DNA binding protein
MGSGPNDNLVLSVEEAGKMLQLSRPSAYLAVKRGQIPVIRVGRRVLVPRIALERMLAEVKPSGNISY